MLRGNGEGTPNTGADLLGAGGDQEDFLADVSERGLLALHKKGEERL
jgi:hypothetical protein